MTPAIYRATAQNPDYRFFAANDGPHYWAVNAARPTPIGEIVMRRSDVHEITPAEWLARRLAAN